MCLYNSPYHFKKLKEMSTTLIEGFKLFKKPKVGRHSDCLQSVYHRFIFYPGDNVATCRIVDAQAVVHQLAHSPEFHDVCIDYGLHFAKTFDDAVSWSEIHGISTDHYHNIILPVYCYRDDIIGADEFHIATKILYISESVYERAMKDDLVQIPHHYFNAKCLRENLCLRVPTCG